MFFLAPEEGGEDGVNMGCGTSLTVMLDGPGMLAFPQLMHTTCFSFKVHHPQCLILESNIELPFFQQSLKDSPSLVPQVFPGPFSGHWLPLLLQLR